MKRFVMISLLLLAAVSFTLSGSSCPPVIEEAATTTSTGETTTTSAGGTTTSTATSTSTIAGETTTTTATTTTTSTSTSTTTTSTTTTTYLEEYYPNIDGYSWTYLWSTSLTTETGTIIHTFDGTTSVDSLTVQKLKMEFLWPSGTSTLESLQKITSSEVKAYGTLDSPTTEAEISYVFPFEVGNTWIHHGSVVASVAAKENITVPAGNYDNCFKIRVIDGTITSDSWLAKNVGIVKVQTDYTTSVVTYELTSKNF